MKSETLPQTAQNQNVFLSSFPLSLSVCMHALEDDFLFVFSLGRV